jgi:uncharacterized protein
MKDLIVGGGLVLVIEGLLWTAAPGIARRLLEAAAATPEGTLRLAGAGTAAAGLVLIWLVRG